MMLELTEFLIRGALLGAATVADSGLVAELDRCRDAVAGRLARLAGEAGIVGLVFATGDASS